MLRQGPRGAGQGESWDRSCDGRSDQHCCGGCVQVELVPGGQQNLTKLFKYGSERCSWDPKWPPEACVPSCGATGRCRNLQRWGLVGESRSLGVCLGGSWRPPSSLCVLAATRRAALLHQDTLFTTMLCFPSVPEMTEPSDCGLEPQKL